MIDVSVRTVTDKVSSFEIPEIARVAELKRKIRDEQTVKSPQFHLLFNGEILDDLKRIGDIELRGKPITIIELKVKDEDEEPPNFRLMVNALMDMGFEQSQCEVALRLSDYNSEAAANLLLSGNLPESDEDYDENEEDEYEGEEEDIGMERPIQTRAKPSEALGPYKSVYENYSSREKAAVIRLTDQFGLDKATVVQVFDASNKDDDVTSRVLSSMTE